MTPSNDVVFDGHAELSEREPIEHVFVDEGDSPECVLMPSDCDSALATEWLAAKEGSYVSILDSR